MPLLVLAMHLLLVGRLEWTLAALSRDTSFSTPQVHLVSATVLHPMACLSHPCHLFLCPGAPGSLILNGSGVVGRGGLVRTLKQLRLEKHVLGGF